MFHVSFRCCLCPIHWSWVLSREWRCSWSSSVHWYTPQSDNWYENMLEIWYSYLFSIAVDLINWMLFEAMVILVNFPMLKILGEIWPEMTHSKLYPRWILESIDILLTADLTLLSIRMWQCYIEIPLQTSDCPDWEFWPKCTSLK